MKSQISIFLGGLFVIVCFFGEVEMANTRGRLKVANRRHQKSYEVNKPPNIEIVFLHRYPSRTYDNAAVKLRLETMVNEITLRKSDASLADYQGNSLRKRSQEVLKQGNTVRTVTTRMSQLYQGLPVHGFEILCRQQKDAKIHLRVKNQSYAMKTVRVKGSQSLVGSFADGLYKDLPRIKKAQYNVQKMLDRMKMRHTDPLERNFYYRMLRKTITKFSEEQAELVIFVDEAFSAKVAYRISFVAEKGSKGLIEKPFYIIDADTEQVLRKTDSLHHLQARLGIGPGGNSKTGKIQYGMGVPKLEIDVDMKTGQCSLNTDAVVTYFGRDNYPNPHSFSCFNQSLDANRTLQAYSSLNDAHYHATKVAQMYQDWYSPLKDALKPIRLVPHDFFYDDNAFWTGTAVIIGSGNDKYFPLTALDILSHEIGHGVTQIYSALLHYGEAAALDEAFCDMAGKAAERFVRGEDGVNWKFGFDSIREGDGGIRCVDNPPCDGHSIDHIRNYQEGMDPHAASGVFNKVYFEMSKRFLYGAWDAFDVFYVANTRFWINTTDFITGAETTMQAVHEMKQGLHLDYVYEHLKTEDAIDAFETVGIICTNSLETTYTCVKRIHKQI